MDDWMVGRDAELAAIHREIARAPSGPIGIVIAGEAGIGKTMLWRAGRRSAQALGFQVLAACPAEPEVNLPFAGIADLLRDVRDEVLDALPAPQRSALAIAMVGAADTDGHPVDQRTVAVALLEALRILSTERAIVVAVDDLQWLDESSSRALAFAARRLAQAAVVFLVSVRVPPLSDDPLDLSRALPQGRLVRLAVGAVKPGTLRQILSTRLNTRVSPTLATRVHEASGGNPFYALELCRALPGKGCALGPGEPLPVPEDLRSLVRRRLQTLPVEGRNAVLVIAATRQPTAALVADVLGPVAEAALRQGFAAGVLRSEGVVLRFDHPLLGSTAYLEALPDTRRQLHRCLARVLTDPEERAHHLALAAAGPDAEIAAHLEAAAVVAAGRGAPNGAAGLAEQACRLTPAADDDGRRRRMTATAWYHLRNGDFARARALLEEVVESSAPGPGRADALRLLGEVRYVGDSSDEAVPLLQRALAEPGTGPHLLASVELDLAFILINSGDFFASRRHACAAMGNAEHADDPELLAQALAVMTVVDFLDSRGLDDPRLQRALALEGHQAPILAWMRPSMIAPMVWMWAGRLDEARDGFMSLHQHLVERGEEASVPIYALYAVQTECWRGDLAAAKVIAEVGAEAARHSGGQWPYALAAATCALLHAHLGDAEATRAEAVYATEAFQQAGFPMHAVWPLWALGLVELSSGNAAAAHDVLGPLTAAFTAAGISEPAAAPFIPEEIEALIGLGHLEAAQELLNTLYARGRAVERPWALAAAARCEGLLLAARGDLDGAEAAIEQALVQHERARMPLEKGRTLLVQGRLLRRRKRKRDAKDVLAEALAIFEGAGADLWAERARQESARVGLRPPAPLDLTATEARVAELAVTGLTTKAIADQVFLTSKTVESVFARIYRKLDVHSRAELATVLANRPEVLGISAGGMSVSRPSSHTRPH